MRNINPSVCSANDEVCTQCKSGIVYSKMFGLCEKCYLEKYNKLRDKCVKKVHVYSIRCFTFEKHLLIRTKYMSKRYKVPFDISIDWIKQKLDRGVCEVSKSTLVIPVYKDNINAEDRMYTPVIVRVDKTKGYTNDNCQVVSYKCCLSG